MTTFDLDFSKNTKTTLDKNKVVPTSKSSFDLDFSKNTKKDTITKVTPRTYTKSTFSQKITGEPVKQKDGTYTPTTGIIDVLSGIPLVGAFTRMGKTLGETKAYNELDDTTREYLARTGQTENVAPDINRKNISVVADAVEGMIDAATGGLSSVYKKGLMSTGRLASSKILNEAEKKLLAPQIMKRFGIDTTLNTASGYSFDVAQNANESKTGKDVFKPGIGTVSAGLLSTIIGGTGAAKLQKSNSADRIAEKYAEKFNVPPAGKPSAGYINKNVQQLPAPRTPDQVPIELPAEGILKGQQVVRDFNKPNEVTLPIPQKQEKKTLTNKGFSDTTSTKNAPTATQVPEMSNVSSPEIKAPINEPITDNLNKKVSSSIEKEFTDSEGVTQFNRGTFDDWSNRIIEKDFDEVVDIALGNKLPTDDIPKGAYYSAVRAIANETGDTNLQLKLALESDVPSKLGQELGSLRIADNKDTISILRDIKAAKEIKMGIKDVKKSQQLKSDLKKSFDKVLKEFEGTVPTKEDVIKILDDITCK